MKSINEIKIGTQVKWKWMGGVIRGTVKEIYFQAVTKVIKNKNIKRNGRKENPAYLVQSEAGNIALKLHTELQVNENEKIS